MIDNKTPDESMDYESFLRDNRYKVNNSLNKILWICIIAGPAIALGILGGVFKQTSYLACAIISGIMALVAGSNLFVLRKKPYSYAPGFIALIAVDFLLCYMNVSHISIRLTWYIVPFLSLLFCDTKVYVGTSVMNYIVMGVGVWLESAHYAEIRTDFTTPLGGFINVFAGCTIEAIIMFAAGFALSRATNGYYKKMMGQYEETQAQKRIMQDQLDVLNSMAEIYDYVALIDFKEATEVSLRNDELHKMPLEEGQDHTRVTRDIRGRVAADMVDDFWRFTDLTTLPDRLVNRKSVSGEFVDNNVGWFRTQFIRVSGGADGKPDVVIHTFQNIDADKRREEHLIRISRTDELTRLYNRHCYEQDVAAIREEGVPEDLVLVSADVNGLKSANDTLGHAAGDELIRGASYCLSAVLGAHGNIYRTGGDEFIAIVRGGEGGALLDDIRRKASEWKGNLVGSLAISLGSASHAEFPEASIEELEKIADGRMYTDKKEYYQQSGNNRRA